MSPNIILPVILYIGWVFCLYAWLTYARTTRVKQLPQGYQVFEFGREEPDDIARITRNLSNQFELPILFLACILFLGQLHALNNYDVVCCWVFLLGRILHTAVQTLTSNVPLRGKVFMINFIAVMALTAHLAKVGLGF